MQIVEDDWYIVYRVALKSYRLWVNKVFALFLLFFHFSNNEYVILYRLFVLYRFGLVE